MILYLARRYDESIEYLQQGLQQEAIDEMKRAVTLSGRSTETLTGLAQAYGAAAMRGDMQHAVDELNERARHRYVSAYNMSRVYAASGDTELAFASFERAYQERNPDLIEVRAEPVFDRIRQDPRFADLLRRVGWRGWSRVSADIATIQLSRLSGDRTILAFTSGASRPFWSD